MLLSRTRPGCVARVHTLVYTLVEEAIPYFIQRHHSQAHGFHGGDLEVQERLRIEAAATSILPDEIVQSIQDPNQFRVKSQSKPDVVYSVDLEAYDCTCPSFPLILMCKHIYAVQTHFSEICEPIHASPFDITSSDTFEHDGAFVNTEQTITNEDAQAPNINSHVKQELIVSLTGLVSQLNPISLSDHVDDDEIHTFQNTVVHFSRRLPPTEPSSLLPQKKKVAPNQKSWPETAQVMGAKVKGKRRTAHTDPYAGGERSGKRAKADALQAPKPSGPSQPTLAMPSTTSQFSPATFDVSNVAALNSLKRPQLFQLCDVYGVKKVGSDKVIAQKLYEMRRGPHHSFVSVHFPPHTQ